MDLFNNERKAKVALTSIYSEVTLDETGPRGLEAATVVEHLGCDVIRTKGKKYSKYSFVQDTFEVNINQYEKIYIQGTPVNFMGGQYSKHSTTIISLLGDFNGEVVWLLNDPMIVPHNPCGNFKRFDVHFDSKTVDAWDDIVENGTYSFGGKSVEKFIGWQPKNVVHDDLFVMIFKRKFGEQVDRYVDIDSKEYDTVYYGALREGTRRKVVRKYMSGRSAFLNNLLIGYKDPKCDAEFIKRVKHNDLLNYVGKSLFSLIVGDDTHNDNIATFRLYETLASDTLCAIDLSYDPNAELIQDPELKKFCYFSDAADLAGSISLLELNEELYNELLSRQKKELNRIFESCTNSL
jgi:hypothetical protein